MDYEAMSKQILDAAGIRHIHLSKGLQGEFVSKRDGKHIWMPIPCNTRKRWHTCAHEVMHSLLHFGKSDIRITTYRGEYESERAALLLAERMGLRRDFHSEFLLETYCRNYVAAEIRRHLGLPRYYSKRQLHEARDRTEIDRGIALWAMVPEMSRTWYGNTEYHDSNARVEAAVVTLMGRLTFK